MKTIQIGKNKIGKKFRPYVIVEACVNHQGNINLAKKMISYAHRVGAQCIKFQHHIVNEEMLVNNVPKSSNFSKPLSQVIEETNFTLEQHAILKKICKKKGIEYLCTPFSIKAAKELNSINVNAFKTGSGELTNHPFIDFIARLNKPMIVSTGMSKPDEIHETVKIIKKHKTPLALTHCVSAYPCPYEIMNLDFMVELSNKYNIPVGLSDHTPTIYNALGAVSLGASIIEKHFTFDKSMPGPDHKSSIDPVELKMLINGTNANFLARGSKKIIHKQEKEIISWARESVVSTDFIRKGEKLSKKNTSTKRPSPKKGEIPAKSYQNVIGKKAKKNIPNNQIIKFKFIK